MYRFEACPLANQDSFYTLPGVSVTESMSTGGPSKVTIRVDDDVARRIVEQIFLQKIRSSHSGISTAGAWMQWCRTNCGLCDSVVHTDEDGALQITRHNYEPGRKQQSGFSIKEFNPADELKRRVTVVFIDDEQATVEGMAKHYSHHCRTIAIHIAGEDEMDIETYARLLAVISAQYPVICVVDKNMKAIDTEQLFAWMKDTNIYTVMLSGEHDTRERRRRWAQAFVSKLDFNLNTHALDEIILPKITTAIGALQDHS